MTIISEEDVKVIEANLIALIQDLEQATHLRMDILEAQNKRNEQQILVLKKKCGMIING